MELIFLLMMYLLDKNGANNLDKSQGFTSLTFLFLYDILFIENFGRIFKMIIDVRSRKNN